jgi:hypothetical protein
MADMVLSRGMDWEKREPKERIEINNAVLYLFIDAAF